MLPSGKKFAFGCIINVLNEYYVGIKPTEYHKTKTKSLLLWN